MITGIYKITNLVNGKIYIGQSLDIERRYKAHINFSKNKSSREYNTPIHNAIRKYGEENFKCEVLIECKKEELDELEKYYIKFFNSTDREKGYNLTPGGLGGHKINCRKVLQYDLKGNFIKEWIAAWEAAESLGIRVENIYACCYGQKSSGGFQWKFKDSDKQITEYKRNTYLEGLALGRHPKSIIGTHQESSLTVEFDMIKNAAIWLLENGYSKSTIESVASRLSKVKNKNIKAYGFLWKTKEGD